jgi:hypothetical protein
MKIRSQMARMEEIRNENKFSVGGSEKKEVSWEGYCQVKSDIKWIS